jgi:hypothetical protein
MKVWITNFNNLERGFRRLVDWLRSTDVAVIVIDNGSTWAPLLKYYETSGLQIAHCAKNLGPYAFWEMKLHQDSDRFIVTDPDVVPSADCPPDLIKRMGEMMDRGYVKVGPSLRIDNLPGTYPNTQQVIDWEQQFWTHRAGKGFEALIDTTFAMYAPSAPAGPAYGLRLAPPYSFEHIPWYEGPEANAERDFYNDQKVKGWTHW